MELSDETKSTLRQMVDDTPVSFDRAKELYTEKADELRQSGAGDDDVAKFAMPMVQSELNQYSSVSPDATTLNALVIGHSGYRGWSDDDFDDSRIASQYGLDDVSKCPVLVAHAVLYPPHDDPALGGIIFRAADHDAMPDGETLESIRSKLTPLARVSGEFTYELSNDVHDYDFYQVNSTKSTDLQVEATDEDVDTRRQEVDTYVPRQVQIANVVSELSETNRYGFAGALGAEMVRVEGVIADYYLSDDGETGVYTMQDNSMPDFRELDESVQGDGRTPGLTCWMQTEQMNYDTDSIVTLYGTLSKSRNSGQISLNTVGIAPQYAQEVNLSPSSQSASTDSQRSSSRSGQVQETTI
jgi:hypothetical protein